MESLCSKADVRREKRDHEVTCVARRTYEGKKEIMKSLAAAIVVLAGAVLVASGVLADALARDRFNNSSPFGMGAGIVVGLIGLIFFAVDRFSGDRTPI